MTYHGHIKNGVAVLDSPIDLPDGTPVRIEVERAGSAFWMNKSIAMLAGEQGSRPVTHADELAGEWPEDESLDEFLAFIREARR